MRTTLRTRGASENSIYTRASRTTPRVEKTVFNRQCRISTTIQQEMSKYSKQQIRTELRKPQSRAREANAINPKWEELKKNVYTDSAKDTWQKLSYFDIKSLCGCHSDNACDENCLNRIMKYECDEDNCAIGQQLCSNRELSNLTTSVTENGGHWPGIEIVNTGNRGSGLRSTRAFNQGQVVVEYTGEVITMPEAKDREELGKTCSFMLKIDSNFIIDATRGSIARFINHSCEPNCYMEKRLVSGLPRIVIVAGDSRVEPGNELTCDYNFQPFSTDNALVCLCGSNKCRGVVGPRKQRKP